MKSEEPHIDHILEKLTTISVLKQKTYRNIIKVFKDLRTVADKMVDKLDSKMRNVDKNVDVELIDISEFEFHIKLSGDILVFMLQTNIVTLNEAHPVMQSPHVQEDRSRGYFGHIMIYNFLSDSVRFNRLDDPGYLIARLMVNHESNFFVEGVRQLNFLFTDISNNLITNDWLIMILEKSVLAAIDIDLIAPNYPDIRIVTLKQKINNEHPMGRGEKIGFQMSADNE
jgi:hypothetical protein